MDRVKTCKRTGVGMLRRGREDTERHRHGNEDMRNKGTCRKRKAGQLDMGTEGRR